MGRQVKKFFKSALSVVLALVMAIPTSAAFGSEAEAASGNFTTPEDLVLVSSTEYAIAPGITETQLITNTLTGNDQEMGYAVTIDLSNPTVSIGAGYANNDGSTWAMQTVRKQAYAAEKDNGYNVVAAVNADFFNMATGAPTGALVMNGTIYHNANRPYFGILNDGTAVIREGKVTSDVREAVGGSVIMLVNGEIPAGISGDYYTGKEPRTAVGIKTDGSVVLFVGDGRQYPKSSGLTIFELAKMMQGLGCVTALNLDGGGSSTFLTEREGESDLVLHNSPSDGHEREVSSSLFVYSTAKSDGIFDHAVLAPNNDVFTPYSEVQFSALGVDKAGCDAVMPEGVSFALAAESADMGTIAESGKFVSSGKEGTVVVNLLYAGAVVGTTTIDVIAPTSVSFTNEEVSMGFSQESDLGLVVKANGRDVVYNSNDFVWTLSDASMGSFNGNIFTSSDSATVTGTITCAYKYNETVCGSVTAIIGKLPTVVWDFENPEDYAGLTTSNYGRGGVQSAEIVSIDDDEPVRFGQRSLKLNYNFINCGAVTEGACVGMTDKVEIPGVPTGIGVWVYAPEGTAPTDKQQANGYSGFWLRGYFTDGAGRNQAFDYTLEPKQCTNGEQPGIYWEGWKYCEADLTKYAAPYSIQPGMTFRLMYVAGTKMGTKTAGAIYFDNLQFVYGANVDDIDSPVIDTIQGNETEITNGMVFDTNTITFTSTFHDVQNKYTSGIDYDVVRMYIDGENVVENPSYVLDKGGNKSWYYDVVLANGTHSVKMLLKDNFGNETTETRFFTVEAQNNEATTMTLAPAAGKKPTLGKTFELYLTASDVKDIKSASVGVKIPDDFTLKSVTFADGFEGSYEVKSKILNVKVSGSATTDSNTVATITYTIPSGLSQGIPFSYYTTLGSFETVAESGKTNTFAVAETKYDVVASLSIIAEDFVVGQAGKLKVVNTKNSPVANATIYLIGDSKTTLGKTDENGEFVTDAFSQESGKYTVSARSGASGSYNYSFSTIVYSYNAVGNEENKPFNILSNATVNGNSEKSLSWMSKSGVEGQAIARVALASEYAEKGEEAFVTYTGTYNDRTFAGGAASAYSTVRVNSVVVTGLEAGKNYVYCVGDGKVWSDVESFSIDEKDGNVNFFIIGDIQAKDLENNTKVINGIFDKNLDYTFGIQTGDAVDAGNNYKYWDELLSSFDANGLQNIDLVHALGNHEYEGDEYADAATDIYNLPSNEMYSVEYDNLYVAVINYKSADNSVLVKTAEWLVEDAKKSNAQWKILVMHQPPYFTNIAGGGKFINETLPKYLEEAGINMVFSGHDHTLARTLPMIGGEVNEDGIVYYICGSTGEKSYAAFNTPEFNFAYTNDSFDAVYTTVQVSKDAISVVNYDLDGSVLDSYVMGSKCAKNGHDYIYDGTELTCADCGETLAASTYVGFAKDANTGKRMYIYLGQAKTGLVETSDGEYIFDENGLGIDGEYTIERMDYVLDNGKVIDKNGFMYFDSSKGKHSHVLRMYENGKLVQTEGWKFFRGNWYYIKSINVCTKDTVIGEVTYKFNEDGTHTEGTFKTKSKKTRYYFAGEMKTGLQFINEYYYFFEESTGNMIKNKEMEIDGVIYTFGPDGYATSVEVIPEKPSTGFWSDGYDTYYFADGVAVTAAFVTVDGVAYYFDEVGHMISSTTVVIEESVCSFDENGKLTAKVALSEYNGFLTVDDATSYYNNGEKVVGWYCVEDNWYYFDNGVMVTRSKTIGGVYYQFGSNGVLLCGTYKTSKSGTKYYYAGESVKGVYNIDGVDYLFNEKGYLVVSAEVEYNGVIYVTDENGAIISATEKPSRPATGFWKEDGYTYYYIDDVMVTNDWVVVEEGTFYFGADGRMVTKTSIIDNAVCTFNADGTLASKESLDTYDGFLSIDGKTYHYVSGTMTLGWAEINGNWYYFVPATGLMVTSNKTIDSVYYIFNADGTLAHGTWKTNSKGTKYYYAGQSLKGLQTIDGVLYFFNDNGYMSTNTTVEIDGVTYIFDENGVGSVYVAPVEDEAPADENPEDEVAPVEAPISEDEEVVEIEE